MDRIDRPTPEHLALLGRGPAMSSQIATSRDLFRLKTPNTGLTDVSGFPQMWDASGVPFKEVIDRLVELAFERHAEKSRNETSL